MQGLEKTIVLEYITKETFFAAVWGFLNMMKYDYQYDDGRRKSPAKAFRLLGIFLVILAITGAILWFVVPHSPENGKQPAAAPAEKEEQTVPQSESQPQKPEAAPAAPEKAPQGEDAAPAKESAETEESPAAGENSSAEGSKKTLAETPSVPAVPEKGVAGPGDLPPEKDVPAVAPDGGKDAELAVMLAEAEKMAAEKQYPQAAELCGKVLSETAEGSRVFRQALAVLSNANWQRIIARDVGNGFAVSYTVKAGDYLGRIARNHNTTVAAAMFINRLKSTNIRVGQKLVLLPGNWTISVSKKMRLLYLFRDGKLFMGFEVGVGRMGKTPTASFVISDRIRHPVYRAPDGAVFKYGEKGNELGDYFLKLAASGTPDRPLLGYGIHGTGDESSVSRSLSNGCIRMRNAEVERLYYIVPTGTPVEIKE